jgi:outer membrane protein assembly factor BamA
LEYGVVGEVDRQGSLSFEDSLSRFQYVQGLLGELHAEGYLSAWVEDTFHEGHRMYARIQSGKRFTWLSLNRGNLEDWIFLVGKFNLSDFQKRPFKYHEVHDIFTGLLEVSQNNGFPFASVRLDSIREQEGQFEAAINVNKGPFISFDTLEITGGSKTNPVFLARRLQVMPGDPFSQKKIDRSIRAINNIPYIKLSGEPQLSFQNEEATLYLPVEDRRMNTLDGIIGVLPNEIEENKWLVTGQFELELYNVSGKGRDYGIHWQRLTQYTQNLRVNAVEPFVLGSKMDLKASFYLLKEDTTFLNRDFRIDVGYRIGPQTYLSFFNRRQAGDLLAVSRYSEAEHLPDVADFRYNNYGLSFTFSKLDDVFSPRKGWFSETMVGLGNKRLLENTGLPQQLYQGLEMNTFQYYFQTELSYYADWRKSLGTLFRLRAGEMDNPNLLLNDLFRLGGLRTIRGFNENYFYAQRYFYLNIEPRYYFDNNSYFLIFADGGLLENHVINAGRDMPVAFGGGFSLETGSGLFNFIYAVGQSNTQPIGINYSRIHFGYTGRF